MLKFPIGCAKAEVEGRNNAQIIKDNIARTEIVIVSASEAIP